MSLDLSVVIVSFNTRELLRECLRSTLASLSCPPNRDQGASDWSWEAWVVDNASPDGSAAMVAADFPNVRLIANEENRGFAAANNQALRQSTGRYVLLLNPDTVVQGSAFAELVSFMDRTPAAGAAGVSLLNPDGTPQQSCFRFPTLLMSFFDFFPLNHRLTNSRLNGRYPLHRHAGGPFAIDHPLGACFIVRRTAAEQVGWLDEDYFMYCEEIDWCLRLKRGGWQIFCVPQAKVTHLGGQSTRQFRGAMLVELHRSRRLLFEKHYGKCFRFAHRQIVRLGAASEVRRAKQLGREGKIGEREWRERLAAYETIGRL